MATRKLYIVLNGNTYLAKFGDIVQGKITIPVSGTATTYDWDNVHDYVSDPPYLTINNSFYSQDGDVLTIE